MNIKEFENAIYIYGTNPQRWPEAIRSKAANFIVNSDKAKELLKKHEALELKIAAGRLHGMSDAKTDSMIKNALKNPQEKSKDNIVKFSRNIDKKPIWYSVSAVAAVILMFVVITKNPINNQQTASAEQEIDVFLSEIEEIEESDDLLDLLES